MDELEGWKNVLWKDEIVFGLNEKRCFEQKPNTAFQPKILTPTVKHGGDSIMVWFCFSALGSWWLAIIDGITKSGLFQQILQENVRVSISPKREARAVTTVSCSCNYSEV